MEKTELLMTLLTIGIIAVLIWVLVTLESRVRKKIFSDAAKKKISIKELRDIEESDSKNPFGEIAIWIEISSEILGISGESVFNKVAMTENGKYWIRVKTTCFIRMDVEWEKMEVEKSK